MMAATASDSAHLSPEQIVENIITNNPGAIKSIADKIRNSVSTSAKSELRELYMLGLEYQVQYPLSTFRQRVQLYYQLYCQLMNELSSWLGNDAGRNHMFESCVVPTLKKYFSPKHFVGVVDLEKFSWSSDHDYIRDVYRSEKAAKYTRGYESRKVHDVVKAEIAAGIESGNVIEATANCWRHFYGNGGSEGYMHYDNNSFLQQIVNVQGILTHEFSKHPELGGRDCQEALLSLVDKLINIMLAYGRYELVMNMDDRYPRERARDFSGTEYQEALDRRIRESFLQDPGDEEEVVELPFADIKERMLELAQAVPAIQQQLQQVTEDQGVAALQQIVSRIPNKRSSTEEVFKVIKRRHPPTLKAQLQAVLDGQLSEHRGRESEIGRRSTFRESLMPEEFAELLAGSGGDQRTAESSLPEVGEEDPQGGASQEGPQQASPPPPSGMALT